ncbi:hypothetical protein NL676_019380 [Syzygium grande]|nr:hypothetical protein NL676_019380 [Syzygium grande]
MGWHTGHGQAIIAFPLTTPEQRYKIRDRKFFLLKRNAREGESKYKGSGLCRTRRARPNLDERLVSDACPSVTVVGVVRQDLVGWISAGDSAGGNDEGGAKSRTPREG